MIMNLVFTVLVYCAYAIVLWIARAVQVSTFKKVLPAAAGTAIRGLVLGQSVAIKEVLKMAPKRTLLVLGVSALIQFALWVSSAVFLVNIWK